MSNPVSKAARRAIVRNVRSTIKSLNDGLRQDVFGDRFHLEIVKTVIEPFKDNSGFNAVFWIEFQDRVQPSRNYTYPFDEDNIIYSGFFAGGYHVDTSLNNFIVNSNFWETYNKDKSLKFENSKK